MKRARSRKGAPGIVEVAKRAGVSPATVSRFYNTPDVVKGPTRNRIEKAALDLGYIRDRMAGMMHSGFSGTIGLIVPTIDNAIFAELIQAFGTRLREHDKTMLIASHNYDLSLEVSIVRSLLERRIDGVALVGFEHEVAPLEMLASRNVPALAIWNYQIDSTISCIGADNHAAGKQIAEFLVECGHRDVALLFPPTDVNDRARDRLMGALDGLGKNLDQVPPNRVVQTSYDIGEAKEATIRLLQNQRPTALLCANDIIAQGAVFACQSLGLSVPDDISVIGIGDFRGSQHMEPPLTTIRLPARRIGEEAADRLCRVIESGQNSEIARVAVPVELKDRGSVKRLR